MGALDCECTELIRIYNFSLIFVFVSFYFLLLTFSSHSFSVVCGIFETRENEHKSLKRVIFCKNKGIFFLFSFYGCNNNGKIAKLIWPQSVKIPLVNGNACAVLLVVFFK